VHGLDYTILKYSNIILSVVVIFVARMLKKKKLRFLEMIGKQIRDYVYVGDVVNGT
jgi:nucleoside-diphosphate-sugar epimerase